jgi:hypothetical protein
MGDLQRWLLFVHLLAAFGFFLAHGASAAVVFRLHRERDPARVRALLELSQLANLPAMILGVILVAAGAWAGIELGAWTSGRLWLWTSVVVLVIIVVAMYALISRHYYPLRERLSAEPPLGAAELAAALADPQPRLGAAIGLVGMVVLVWLMVFRPF